MAFCGIVGMVIALVVFLKQGVEAGREIAEVFMCSLLASYALEIF